MHQPKQHLPYLHTPGPHCYHDSTLQQNNEQCQCVFINTLNVDRDNERKCGLSIYVLVQRTIIDNRPRVMECVINSLCVLWRSCKSL